MRILLIEDNDQVAGFVCQGFREAGHTIDHADNGKDGLFLGTTENYDVMIVDRMLPGLDGLSLIRTMRASENSTPIIILSALDEVDERVKGLEAGSDDYLAKPFAFSELAARVDALYRRSRGEPAAETKLTVGNLEMDLLRREVRRGDEPVNLFPREFRLLEYLMRHAGHVVTRTMLLEHVWDYNFDPQTNVVDVQISRLRAKIDKDGFRPLIQTVRGAGYKIDAPE